MKIVWLALGSLAFALPAFAAIWVLAGLGRDRVLGGPGVAPWRVRVADPIMQRVEYWSGVTGRQIRACARRLRRTRSDATSTPKPV